MSSIRGHNSFQASPELISKISSMNYLNNTIKEDNMLVDISSILTNIMQYNLYIIPIIIIITVLIGIINYKQIASIKLQTTNLYIWINNLYKSYTTKDILPVNYRKKLKESPFIGSQPTPLLHPGCNNLDQNIKGQNLQFQFSMPYRRFQSSENLNTNDEHRITITTVIQKSPQLITN